jgi:hypothetical protein
MTSLSNTDAPGDNELLHGRAISQLDWHDARKEYDHSVMDLLAAIRRCSAFALTDEEKCHLIEGARRREQAAFVKYKRVLEAS